MTPAVVVASDQYGHERGWRLAPRVGNLADWQRHILDGLHERGPHPHVRHLIEELESYRLPEQNRQGAEAVGFAVPLQLRSSDGDLQLVATIATFATALDVTVSELRLEAFLPADAATVAILRARNVAPSYPGTAQ